LNPKEKELVDFFTSKNSEVIKAISNIQKAQEIITSKAEADAKSKALTDMKRALDALMSARTLDPSSPGRTAYLDRLQQLEEEERGEGAMADSQLNRIADLASMIDEMVDDDTNLPEWVESKITKAQDYMSAVMNYMKGEQADAQEDIMEEET